jgi:hypothetical protein
VSFDQISPAVSDGGDPPVYLPVYSVRFTFSTDPNGWNPSIVYTDPDTGQPVPDATAKTNATATVDLYDSVDYGTLPL